MGAPTPIALGVRSNPARNSQAGNATLINCFSEEAGEDAKNAWLIYGTAGLTNFGSALIGGGIRAMIVVNTTLYAVAGRSVYAVTSEGIATKIGGIQSDGAVYMERNRRVPAQIGIVAGGFLFVIDTGSNVMTAVLDPDLTSPISLSFLDGFGILPIANGEYILTSIDDFTQIDGLDVGTAEAYPDEIVRSAVLEQELVLFGETSIEWHTDTGAADFPFARSHATELGCLAPDSVAKVDSPTIKTLIWVAPDHTVRQMSGYSGNVISTNEISKLIKELHSAGEIGTLKGFSWADAGRFFYALTCQRWTRVYDGKTGHWHVRQSYGLDNWRVSSVVQFGTKLIAGDYTTGQLYEMNDRFNTEGANHLVAEIITPTVHAFPYGLKFNAMYIDAATGVGKNTATVHSSDPKIMVSWSDDGGDSFSKEREVSLGRLGQKAKRVKPITRMGTCGDKGRMYRLRISSPVERLVVQVAVDFDKLSAR